MDYGKAFNYFTEDASWVNKFLIGALLGIIPIVNFFVSGYMLRIIDAMPEDKTLPEWDDWGILFRNGAFLFLAFLVYSIPMIIVGAIALAFLIPVIIAADKNAPVQTAFIIIPVIAGLFILAYALVLSIISPAIVLTFNKNKSAKEALQVGEIFRITKEHFKEVIIIVLVLWGVSLAIGALAGFPLLGFLIGIAGGFYSRLITGHLYGQLKEIIFPSIEAAAFEQ